MLTAPRSGSRNGDSATLCRFSVHKDQRIEFSATGPIDFTLNLKRSGA